MQTCNSPPQACADALPSLPDTIPNASWSLDDEIAFIEYITDHKAQAGDGVKFKPSFWTSTAKAMLAHTALGGPKTASRCSAKWDRVRTNPSHVIYYQLTHPHQLKKLYNIVANIKKKCLDSLGMTRRA
jgi:hypothetical protein